MATRILLIDDHSLVRAGLRAVFSQAEGIEVVGEAADTESGLASALNLRPDVAIVDLAMPGAGGISLIQRLKDKHPESHVIVLTAHAEPHLVDAALRAGASGYVLKSGDCSNLMAALKTAVKGGLYLCPEVSSWVGREYQRFLRAGAPGALSARETEILRKIADGMTTKEIAHALGLSSKTVETHRVNLMGKLKLNNVAALTKYAIAVGLTQPLPLAKAV